MLHLMANIVFAKEDEGETPDTPDEPEIIKGDVSGDGKINAMDANAAKRVLNGSAGLTDAQRAACDVNGDGQINAIDVNIIGRYLLGFISSLG